MLINEIFFSVQGEGKLTGVPSVFIRTAGCNLRCHWCDSPDTSWAPQGVEMSEEEILATVTSYSCPFVVLTGGEPMIASGVESLTAALRRMKCHITIETAGTVWKDITCDLASVSPKLAHSTPSIDRDVTWSKRHEQKRIDVNTIRKFLLCEDYQLKFVIDQPGDMDEVQKLIEDIGDVRSCDVLLMPQGVVSKELQEKAQWLVDICKSQGYRFCSRMHIDVYGHTRGT